MQNISVCVCEGSDMGQGSSLELDLGLGPLVKVWVRGGWECMTGGVPTKIECNSVCVHFYLVCMAFCRCWSFPRPGLISYHFIPLRRRLSARSDPVLISELWLGGRSTRLNPAPRFQSSASTQWYFTSLFTCQFPNAAPCGLKTCTTEERKIILIYLHLKVLKTFPRRLIWYCCSTEGKWTVWPIVE